MESNGPEDYDKRKRGRIMDDSIRTAKYYAPNYTALPTRQCLVCGVLENYSVSATVVDTSLPWLCDRCRSALLKLIKENEDG